MSKPSGPTGQDLGGWLPLSRAYQSIAETTVKLVQLASVLSEIERAPKREVHPGYPAYELVIPKESWERWMSALHGREET